MHGTLRLHGTAPEHRALRDHVRGLQRRRHGLALGQHSHAHGHEQLPEHAERRCRLPDDHRRAQLGLFRLLHGSRDPGHRQRPMRWPGVPGEPARGFDRQLRTGQSMRRPELGHCRRRMGVSDVRLRPRLLGIGRRLRGPRAEDQLAHVPQQLPADLSSRHVLQARAATVHHQLSLR